MPQLDFSTYYGQVFWFLISFAILYFFINNWFYPRVQSLLNKRESKIRSLMNEVEDFKIKIKQIELAYNTELHGMDKSIKKINEEVQFFCKKHYDEQISLMDEQLLKQKNQASLEMQKWQDELEQNIQDITVGISEVLLNKVVNNIDNNIDLENKVNFSKYFNKIKDDNN